MKRLLFIAVLILSFQGCRAQSNQEITTFILVRHAEKGTDDPRDPSLNEVGKLRAQKLLSLLSATTINAIYSSPYKRTQQTVQPMAEKLGLAITEYNPGSNDFIADVMKKHTGETILVSGHSNTVPTLANFLLGEEKFSQLDENEYDNVFIISFNQLGKGKVTVLKY